MKLRALSARVLSGRRSGLFQALMSASMLTSILPASVAQGTPTYTRASTATVIDHEGVVRLCKSGETRGQGWRRVENNIPTDVSTWGTRNQVTIAQGVADPDGGLSAYTLTATAAGGATYHPNGHPAGASSLHWMWVRRRTGIGIIVMYNGGASGATTDITSLISSAWVKIVCPLQTSTGGRSLGFSFGSSGDAIDVYHGQAENVTGQSIQTPAEYVPTGTGGPNFGAELGTLPYAARGTVTGSGTFTATTTSVATTQYGIVMALPTGALVAGKTYRIYAKLNSKATTDPTQQLAIYASTDQNSGVGAQQLVISNTSGAFVLYTPGTTQTLTLRSDTGTATVGDSWNFTLSVTECLYSGANVDGVKYFDTRLDGRPIYEPFGPALNFAANYGVPGGFDGTLSAVTDAGFSTTAGTGAQTRVYLNIATIVGRTYEVVFSATLSQSASVFGRDTSNGAGLTIASANVANGLNVFRFTATTTASCVLWVGSPIAAFSVTGMVVREIKPLNGLGIEQVINGEFLYGTNNWGTSGTAYASTLSVVNGALRVTKTQAVGMAGIGNGSGSISLIPGRRYSFKVTAVGKSGNGTFDARIGTSLELYDYGRINTLTAGQSGEVTFIATTTTAAISLISTGGAAGDYNDWGNISVREVTMPAGYLNEPQRTNLFTQSEDVSATPWGVDSSGTGVLPVRTANYGVSPRGTQTACRVVLDRGAGTGFSRLRQVLTGQTSGIYSGSIWLKTTDGSTKTVGVRNDAKGVAVTVTGTWKRYTVTTDVSVTTPDVQVILWDTLNTSQTADLLVWQGQVELGSTASSDIFTTTAAAVRAADSLAMPVSVTVGPTNSILWSNDLTNAAWVKGGGATAPSSNTANLPATNAIVSQPRTLTATVGSSGTAVFLASGSGSVTLGVGRVGSGAYEESRQTITLSATPTLYAVALQIANAGQTGFEPFIARAASDTATAVTIGGIGLFPGTLTASQIQASGGIPLTTTVPNANSQGTMVVTLIVSGADAAGRYPGVMLRGSASTNGVGLYTVPGLASLNLVVRSNGVGGAQPNIVTSPTAGTAYKVAVSWDATGRVAYCVNGGTVGALTGQVLPLSLNTFDTKLDYEWLGTVPGIQVYSPALPDWQLQKLTA